MLAAGEKTFILRMPIIPGVNNEPEYLQTVANQVKGAKALACADIQLFQRAAGAKYKVVGKAYAPEFDKLTR